jgi:hypothetical protein
MKAVVAVFVVCTVAYPAGSGISLMGYQVSSVTITVTATQTFPRATTITSEKITTTTATTPIENDVLKVLRKPDRF